MALDLALHLVQDDRVLYSKTLRKAIIMRRFHLALYSSAFILVACAGDVPESGVNNVGKATAALELDPVNVQCVVVQIQGSSTVTQQFNASPEGTSALNLTGLPTGSDVFTAKAYAAPCAQTPLPPPVYTSNPVTVTVTAGTIANVSLPMNPVTTNSGQATVGVNFPTQTQTPAPVVLFNVPTQNAGLSGIANGPDGNLWFTETFGAKIGKITPAGAVTEFALPSTTGNPQPQAITTGPDGNIWFTDDLGKIGRATSTGTITEFVISVPGDLLSAIIAGPDGNLWFTEYTRNKVGRVSTGGNITEFSLVSGSGPVGIAVGADRNLWVAEEESNKIARVTQVGALTEFGGLSTQSGGVSSDPFSVTAGADGNIWFAEAGTGSIGRITSTGTVTEFPVPDLASGGPSMTSGPDGNVWFAGHGTLGQVTPSGVVTEFPIPTTNQPSALVAGPDGNIWFTLTSENKIGRLTP
jgi:streptogramin lyase